MPSANCIRVTNLLLIKALVQNAWPIDCVLYQVFSLTFCSYVLYWFTVLFRKFCHLAGYLFKSYKGVCKTSVSGRTLREDRTCGTWRRSPVVYVECCCKYTKGKRPNSKWHLEATIAKPKALESLQGAKQQKRKKGTDHLKPISEYFVGVQAFPLTGFPTAERVSCCLATLPHYCWDLLSSPGFKMFHTVANLPEQPKSLRKWKLTTAVLAWRPQINKKVVL